MTDPQFTTEELNSEEWKPVENYEGSYEVSSLGRVKSLNYRGNEGEIKVLRTGRNSRGYIIATLYKAAIPRSFAVHRLVATAFLIRKEGQCHVNHKDSDGTNNRKQNLEWCTPKENTDHRDRNGSRIAGSQHWTHLGIRPRKKTNKRVIKVKRSQAAITPKQSTNPQPTFTVEELMHESWKAVPDLERYEVSSLGRVRRVQACKGRPANYIFRQVLSTTGCWQVSLQTPNGEKRFLTHRLVATAFHGRPTEDRPWVNHKDGNRLNARESNLEWVSPKENAQHATEVLQVYPHSSDHHGAKLTERQVIEIHSLRMQGYAANYIAGIYSVQKKTILSIIHRETWKKVLRDFSCDYPPVKRQGRRF